MVTLIQSDGLARPFKQLRPAYIWLIGVVVFTPSLVLWGYYFWMALFNGRFNCAFDSYGVRYVYLPLFAAIAGFFVPAFCFLRLRHASRKKTISMFVGYVMVMLIWGVLDIKNENYQIGGHDYPNSPQADGHKHYWHLYLTWYFLPHKFIHGYEF